MLKSIKSECTHSTVCRERGEPNRPRQAGGRPTARRRVQGLAVRRGGVRPRCGSRARPPRAPPVRAARPPDTSVSTDHAASWTAYSPGLCARIRRPGLSGARSPEPRFAAAPEPGRLDSLGGAAPPCRCRLPAGRPRHPRSRRRPKVCTQSSAAIPASRPPNVPPKGYGCRRRSAHFDGARRHRQRTLTELANTPVASVEMITSRHAHVGITRPTSTSRTILTPMKTRSSATACCRYWNDLISPTTNV